VEDANLSVQISAIRRVLSGDGGIEAPVGSGYIATVAGYGYKFIAQTIEDSVPENGRVGELHSGDGPLTTGGHKDRDRPRATELSGGGLSPGNISQPLTSLIGREQETAEVVDLLQQKYVRLLTLTGAAGSGKTRLAIDVGVEAAARFPDGVFFVSLAPLMDPALVERAIAQTLEIAEEGAVPVQDLLKRFLQHKETLLVLDNFEHLLSACGTVLELLSACPGLKVLVTSRTVLKVRGEQEYLVEPLALPDKDYASMAAIEASSAVALFVERARAVRKDFALTAKNASTVAEICSRLDGLPLAIELAAARVKLLAPDALLKRLEHRFEVLTGGARDLPSRQRTIRDTIDWSYGLLDESEKRLLARLSVFAGGFSLEAAEAVCGASEGRSADVLDGISSLADWNLIAEQKGHKIQGQTRFYMLETIREYAQERLLFSGEADEIRSRHAQFFLRLAEEIEPDLLGRDLGRGLDVAQTEAANFRGAMSSLRTAGGFGESLRIASSLRNFWGMRGSVSEGRGWLELGGGVANVRDAARALAAGAVLALKQRGYEEADAMLREALSRFQAVGDELGVASVLAAQGTRLVRMDKPNQALPLLEGAIERFRSGGNLLRSALTLNDLGTAKLRIGDLRQAFACFLGCIKLSRRLDCTYGLMVASGGLGLTFLRGGDHQRAATWMARCLRLCLSISIDRTAYHLVQSVAQLLHSTGEFAVAATLAAASELLMSRAGVLDACESEWRDDQSRLLASARERLSREEFSRALQSGNGLGPRGALLLALGSAEQIAREAPRSKDKLS
ncbi:MAG: AAA family ATPase, partial [Blastocatellia bacterium]